MPQVNVDELRQGDLILTKAGSIAGHAEIFTSNSHFEATTVHAVNDPSKDLERVMPTSLRADPAKHAFRCRNSGLADKAAAIAIKWAAYENRYDSQRMAFSNGSMRALPGFRRLGMPAFSARSMALDGVSWVQGG